MPKIPRVAVLIESSRAYDRNMLRGIARYVRLKGPWNFYSFPPPYLDPNRTLRRLEILKLKEWKPDGIIMRQPEGMEELLALKVPTIIAPWQDTAVPNVRRIGGNNIAIGEIAAGHLLEQGLTNFAFCGLEEFSWSDRRCDGFCKRIARAGYEAALYRPPASQASRIWENEQPLLADWLKQLPRPVGIMACTDERSRNIVEAAKSAGLSIPDQAAIIGCDNDELICEFSNPQLSSVVLDTERAGYEAAAILDKMMAGKARMTGKEILVRATHVAARQSTNVLAVDDPWVSGAMQYIREHAGAPISVNDVSKALNISRTDLYKRFRREIKRSILQEINRVRTQRVARMLLETDRSVSQIANDLGFSEPGHMARFFIKQKKISPTKYRSFHLNANPRAKTGRH